MTLANTEKRIKILRSANEIKGVREFWNSCDTSRDLDFDFFFLIVDLFPEVLRPHVVALYEGSTPRALLIGRLERARVQVKVGYVDLPVPQMTIIQLIGWLGETEENSEQLMNNIFESLSVGEADVAFLNFVRCDSELAMHAKVVPPRLCSDFLNVAQSHRVYDCNAASPSFLASLSANERSQQKKRGRKLLQQFKSHIQMFTSPEDVPRLIRDAEMVAAKSYQRDIGVGFSDSAVIRSRLEFEATRGWLRAYVLYLNEDPCAFWIGSLRNRIFLSDYLAFDPKYSSYAPGMYLVMNVMEILLSNAPGFADRVDFGVGAAAYKERLSNSEWQETTISVFAPRLIPVLVNALRSTTRLLTHLIKTTLQRTRLLNKAKRIIRESYKR